MRFIPIVDDCGNAYLVSADKVRQIVFENYTNIFPDGTDLVRVEFIDGFTQDLCFATKAKTHGLFLALSDKLNRDTDSGDIQDA
ncbi:MAG TPA: hypothetical protein O0X27_06260 [Methanocorpusculum sp.]|nr:hypothetical protein [Methanocorpusculum sp.]